MINYQQEQHKIEIRKMTEQKRREAELQKRREAELQKRRKAELQKRRKTAQRRIDKLSAKLFTPSPKKCNHYGGTYHQNHCLANWYNAKKICAASGGELPSKNILKEAITVCDEYASIVNQQPQSCYGKIGFSAGVYWSSTVLLVDEYSAWYVYFYDGKDDWFHKSDSHFIRCIRAGQ